MSSQQKIAVVTGANRGLGFALAQALGKKGYLPIIICRSEEKGQIALANLEKDGIKAVLKVADMAVPEQIEAVCASLQKEFSHIDVLINNAAINIDGEDQRIANLDLAKFTQTIASNVQGPLLMCKGCIPLLIKSKDARVVNFSSGLGQLSVPRMGPFPSYSISKTAINAITTLLADELKDTSVKVMSVDPGWVRTGMGGPMAPLKIGEGIDTPLWLATAESSEIQSGAFYKERQILGW